MSPKPPIERLDLLVERLQRYIDGRVRHAGYLVNSTTAEFIEIERELLEILAALKGDPK